MLIHWPATGHGTLTGLSSWPILPTGAGVHTHATLLGHELGSLSLEE